MNFYFSKKLLGVIKPKVTQSDYESDVYSWHADYIVIHKKRMIVFVNDATRFSVVIHGMSIDVSEINRIFKDALNETLLDLGCHQQCIDLYLGGIQNDAFHTFQGRKQSGQLDKVIVDCSKLFEEYNIVGENQYKLANRLNIGANLEDMSSPYQKLISMIKEL